MIHPHQLSFTFHLQCFSLPWKWKWFFLECSKQNKHWILQEENLFYSTTPNLHKTQFTANLRSDKHCPACVCKNGSYNFTIFLLKKIPPLFLSLKTVFPNHAALGAGIAQWLEHRTRDWKVAGSNPCWNGGRIFFSRVDFLCWLLFRYPFHPRVTTVAHKKSRSFCQKSRWQVTAKHAYTLRMWILLNRASALVTTCP